MTERWSYWNGPDAEDRRIKFASAFLPEYQANGDDLQRRIEAVVTAFFSETGIELPEGYASGWRPPSVNESTANAGKLSTHLRAQGGDKRDSPDGEFAWWCFRTQHVLEVHGVYMEHPAATVVRSWATAAAQKRTPTPWCHLQSVPPASHIRVYWPDSKASGEWETFIDCGGYPGATYETWQALQPKKGSASRDV